MSDIIQAVKQGELATVQKLLDKNPSLASTQTEQNISILQFAAYCGFKEIVALLATVLAEINLFEACCIGDIKAVNNCLNQKNQDINSFSNDGFTALGLACFFGHLEIVTVLLDKGADPNIPSNNAFKVAPLHSACAISNYDIAKTLIQHGADVNATQMRGVSPLHSAAHNGNTEIIQLLLDNGADINAKMEDGKTPLDMAEEAGYKECAELLTIV